MPPGKKNIFTGQGTTGDPGTIKPTTDMDRSTKQIGKLTDEYDKEVVFVIWKFKGISSCGHAALKLKRLDEQDKKVKNFEYISWWPKSSDLINTDKVQQINRNPVLTPLRVLQPRMGEGHKDYWTDEEAELSSDKQIAIFLSFLYRACNDERPALVKKYLESYWQGDKKKDGTEGEQCRAWRAMGFTENFGNMETMIAQGRIGLGARQKVQKNTRYVDPVTRKFDTKKILDDVKRSPTLLEMNQEYLLKIGKLPDEKIYLPCSYLTYKTDDGTPYRFVWGLSQDAIRRSWRIFKDTHNPQWIMLTNKINCASVAWNRLMDGYAEELLEGNTGDLISALQRKIYIQPNNIIEIGERLDKALKKLNEQQKKIDEVSNKHYAKIRPLAQGGKILKECEAIAEKLFNKKGIAKGVQKNKIYYENEKTNLWPPMLQSSFWLDISKTKSMRSSSLRKIDDAVKAFQAVGDKLDRYEEHRLIASILQDEKRYLDLIDELDKALKQKTVILFNVRSIEEKLDAVREMMKVNFVEATKHKREKIKQLIKLHNAIFHYVNSAKDDDERLPSVLFLGQCVACAFAETAHHGVYVLLAALDNSFYPAFFEEILDKQEAVVSPTVSVMEHMQIMKSEIDLPISKYEFPL